MGTTSRAGPRHQRGRVQGTAEPEQGCCPQRTQVHTGHPWRWAEPSPRAGQPAALLPKKQDAKPWMSLVCTTWGHQRQKLQETNQSRGKRDSMGWLSSPGSKGVTGLHEVPSQCPWRPSRIIDWQGQSMSECPGAKPCKLGEIFWE